MRQGIGLKEPKTWLPFVASTAIPKLAPKTETSRNINPLPNSSVT